MILQILTHTFTDLAMCTATRSQPHRSLRQFLSVSRRSNPILKPASFNVRIAQSNIISTGFNPNPVHNNTITFLTSKSIMNDF